MAFRFPGDLGDESTFWNALKEGADLVTEVSSERWATTELQHPKRAEPGRSITFSAGVLSRIGEFDASFFGISPREAALMDPQQRLLLELAWEAMENGGCVPSSLAGSDCAVYVGISSLDYGTRGLDDLAAMSSHSMTGNTLSIAANRLSFIFDLHGPSLAVDTACSSSLVALHHACNSLRAGEASTALVGGVNLLLHPYPFVGFTKASMLSADGRCKAFDAAGDGYVRGEGGAVLLLKPLKQAVADGDNIQAIIRATGVNADGARKTGITIPSKDGQAELMQAVLERSGLKAEDVDFVEAHGTGTAVGDPIETAAIGTVYGQCRPIDAPLPIGSVKTNVGHLEPASGMAGLVKAILALKHQALPPSLHLKTPNPHIDFSGLNLKVVTEYTELPTQADKPLVAGVNSFGFGGANAHVLVQEYRLAEQQQSPLPDSQRLPPLFLSARSMPALRAMAGRYAELLTDKTSDGYYDIAYASAYRRERLEKRLVLQVDDTEQAADALARFAQGETVEAITVEEGLSQPGEVAFIYSGNGAQWVGMGRKLIEESGSFAEILDDLDARIGPQAGFSIIAELQVPEESSRLDDTTIAQPLLFAIQVALTICLREQGIHPKAVSGHSVGEVAAAWAAGALDLEQAIRVICMRSVAQGLTRGTGRMAAVALSEAAMKDMLAEMDPAMEVEIAGVNSPANITISGSLADLEHIGAQLEAKGIFFRLLDLDYAFHSRQMDPIESRLKESLAGLAPCGTSQAAFVSTVTGDMLDGVALNADYWWRNVRQPVRFAAATTILAELGCRVFVEIGPHAILQRYIGESLKAAKVDGRVLPTLRKNDDGWARLQEAALRMLLLTNNPDLSIHFPVPGRHVRLPNYPWQRERHWHPVTSESHQVLEHRRVHPLLGWRLATADFAWENVLDPLTLPWLADHQVGGAIVLPGAAYAEMALAAAREWLGKDWLAIEELDIVSPVVFDGEHARSLRFSLDPRDGGFKIQSRQRLSEVEWTLHAAGRIIEMAARAIDAQIPLLSADAETMTIERATHYRLAETLGLQYGPSFQGLGVARAQGDLLEATLDLPEPVALESGYLLHPAVLDICYQSLVDFFQEDIEAGRGVALLPIKLGKLVCRGNADPAATIAITGFRARMRRRSARSVLADFELFDGNGQVVAQAAGCRFRAAPLQKQSLSHVDLWRIVPRLQPHPVDGLVTDLPPPGELAKRIYAWFNEHEATLKRETWFKQTLPFFEALTLSFAFEAFRTLIQQRPEWLQEKLNDRYSLPYLRWLANCLRQEQLLVEHAGTWRLEGEIPAADEIWQAILRDSPASLPQLAMAGQIGRHLPELLTGEIDPHAFLARMRQSASAESLQDEDPAYLGMRQAVQQTLAALADEFPVGRRLRILEITDGVSEVPRAIHAQLSEDRLDYVLAVVEDAARERCHAEYQNLANVVVASITHADWTLVADRPVPAAFDAVVLRHVLHRATSPKAALTKAKRWLAQGGVLLIAEQHPDWSADFISGPNPAWWHEREDGLPMSSLLPPEAWEAALREEGFEGVTQVAEPAADGLSEGAYLLIASRAAKESVVLPSVLPASWRLLVDAESLSCADHLRRRLEAQGQQVSVSTPLQDGEDARTFDHVVYLRGWKATTSDQLDLPANLLQQLQFASTSAGKPPRFWLLTHGGAAASELAADCTPNPLQTSLWGMGRVAMNEAPALSCTLIDLACDPAKAHVPERLENEFLRPDGLNEIVLTPDARYSLNMRTVPQFGVHVASERYRLDFRIPGKLRNLCWLPETERSLRDHEIEVRPHAVGLNFRDVMYLMGLLPDEAVENGFAGASLGLEFSGVVSRIGARVRDHAPGDAVMGFGSACFASHIVTRDDAVASMPENWSFEAAATVPTVFFTVYYALHHLADLQPGERVLIHGAAGGVGLAAIQLARHLGAEIYATAGSDEKRDFVSLLGADHVFDSRSLSFADDILAVTQGEGVDVVLNSLAGEAIRRNLAVLKPFGRFLELGKRDFYENTPIGLRPFKDNISYFGIDADQLLTGRPALAARLFREVMALFREGVLSPLPWRAFPAARVVDAFRVMQQARHIGKVVVSMDGAAPQVEHFREVGPVASSRFEKDSTWLVTGGLSGFGLESARWLAGHGVGHLVLLGRRGLATPGAQEAIAALEAQGARVEAVACDIADRDALAKIIERIRKTLPPLKGVLHAAATFDDALLAKLDAERMTHVLRPKLLGAWHLHQLTLDIPLEHFVLYSSVTTFIGNPGQTNYVAANAGLEGLTALRHVMGLPATCIAWGPIGDAGFLTRHEAVKESLSQRLGKAPVSAAAALGQLDRLLHPDAESFAIANFDWSVLSRMLPSAQSARFAELNRQKKDRASSGESMDIHALILGKSPEEVTVIVRDLVVQEVAQILCIGADRIEPQRSLHDLGMDSLMAVELALGLEQRFGIQLPVMMLNESPTADKVTARIVDKLLGSTGDDALSDGTVNALVQDLAKQHGENVTAEDAQHIAEGARMMVQEGARLTA